MPKELIKTPVGEVRWFKLTGAARPNKFDPTKAPGWSTDFILDNTNPDHQQFLLELEEQFSALHGAAKKHSKAFPWGPLEDKDRDGKVTRDNSKTVIRFKATQFSRNDGTTSEGPRLMDSAKNPWDHNKELANGSKVIIAFNIYAWQSPTGAGITLEPKAVMVVDYIPFDRVDAADLFDEVPGGYVGEACPF
jgi:hypothetical protein